MALVDDTRHGDLARSRIAGDPSLHAPHLLDLEVLSLLRRLVRSDDLDERRANLALADLEELPVTRYPHVPFAARVWELRQNVTPYDAVYVALAEVLECALVTADRRLTTAAGVRCEVELLSAR